MMVGWGITIPGGVGGSDGGVPGISPSPSAGSTNYRAVDGINMDPMAAATAMMGGQSLGQVVVTLEPGDILSKTWLSPAAAAASCLSPNRSGQPTPSRPCTSQTENSDLTGFTRGTGAPTPTVS